MDTVKEAILQPIQVCYVVRDVATAMRECEERFGWGPFRSFTAPNPKARYFDWQGTSVTEVALGMAGDVQVELIHSHEGRSSAAAYQERYGSGPQHIGIFCRSREAARAHLGALGAPIAESDEVPGVRFSFVDAPHCAPGVLELLEIEGPLPKAGRTKAPIEIDRASFAVADLDAARSFLGEAFEWQHCDTWDDEFECDAGRFEARRALARAHLLEIELVEPRDRSADMPYAAQLRRGDHGLVHAGAQGSAIDSDLPPALRARWCARGERLAYYPGPCGSASVQLRAEG